MSFSNEQVLYLDNDGAYGADELGLPYRDLIVEGVVDYNGADFYVVQRASGANMSVDVQDGACWIKGDDDTVKQPMYRYREPAVTNLTIAAADPTNPRKDIVIAEILDSTFSGSSKLGRLRVITGTPAPLSPVEPPLPNNAIKLATISVAALATSIVDANITDRRPPAYLGRPQRITAASFAFLAAAADSNWNGLEIALEVDAANGIYWRFRYRSASGSIYKWEFMGGPPMAASVDTDESTASTSYTALATAGPSITVPYAGDYDIEVGSVAYLSAINTAAYHSFDIGGTGAVDADAVVAAQGTSGASNQASGVTKRRKTLSGAVALVSKYKVNGGTGHWKNRFMRVAPIRIG